MRTAIEELLIYPVTTGSTDHPLGYYGAVDDFYDESAERLSKHLDAGRTVVVLAEGDPLFYSSYMYLHDRLSSALPERGRARRHLADSSATALRMPLARHEDILTVLPGTLPVPELARRLADTDAAVIMKLGRTFAGVREALRQAGRLSDAHYVERATTGEQRVMPVIEVDPGAVPYFSMIVVPGRDRRLDSAGRSAALRLVLRSLIMSTHRGSLLLVLGRAVTVGRLRRYRRCWPGSIMSSAMGLISTDCRPAESATARLRQYRRSGTGQMRS